MEIGDSYYQPSSLRNIIPASMDLEVKLGKVVISLSSLFVNENKFKLEYFQPKKIGDKVLIEPPSDVNDEGRKRWKKALVGNSLTNRRLSFKFNETLRSFGEEEVHSEEV